MQIGFNLPISGPLSGPETMTRLAREGEALGYDYLTLNDHIVLPNLGVPGYPYSESGAFFDPNPERRHDQLTAAAFIAAKTRHIRLVFAVMVVPYRPAVLAAKMLATIDVLSAGRLTVGIGAGWLEAEFDALAVPFAARGALTDEYVRAFRTLWTEPVPRFAGDRSASTASSSSRSRSKSRIRRSGSAAKADPRCAAPPASAMPGIRSAATTGTCSTPCRAIAPASGGSSAMPPRPAATRRKSLSPFG
jgi:alkanesulfonate monooxygenase SsuD/methylene tetrahydromethanopterin reductase-like flavin-dependent oxidoreductase (luciferase family)